MQTIQPGQVWEAGLERREIVSVDDATVTWREPGTDTPLVKWSCAGFGGWISKYMAKVEITTPQAPAAKTPPAPPRHSITKAEMDREASREAVNL